MNIGFRHLAFSLLKILFPPKCLCCSHRVVEYHCLCSVCYAKLVFYRGKSLERISDARNEIHAAFAYEGIVKDLILSYKFSGKTHLAILFAKFLKQVIDIEFSHFTKFDFIVFVPLHPLKFFMRSYNQGALLAKKIAESYDAIVIYDILVRCKYRKAQSLLTHKQRLKNIKGVFRVNDKYKTLIAGSSLLLIDDVSTTGATLEECCKELNKLSPRRITRLTIARTDSCDIS